jgi:hypothetical protein
VAAAVVVVMVLMELTIKKDRSKACDVLSIFFHCCVCVIVCESTHLPPSKFVCDRDIWNFVGDAKLK